MLKDYKLNKKIDELQNIIHHKINILDLSSNTISYDFYKEKISELYVIADRYFQFDGNLIEYINEVEPDKELKYKKNYYEEQLTQIKEDFQKTLHFIDVFIHDDDEDLWDDDDKEKEKQKISDLRKLYIEYKALNDLNLNDYSDLLVDSIYSFIAGLNVDEAWSIDSVMRLSDSVHSLSSSDSELSYYYPKKFVQNYDFKFQDYFISRTKNYYFKSSIFGYIPQGVEKFYKGIRAIKSSYELAEIDSFKQITKELEA